MLLPQTNEALLANDNVVEQVDIQQFTSLDEKARHFNIVAAG